MEELLKEKFGLSKLVVCTDGGLSSYENRKNDSVGDRAFITVQSLKKLKKPLQDWALKATGWHMSCSNEEYDISQLNPDEYYNVTSYKERWEVAELRNTLILHWNMSMTRITMSMFQRQEQKQNCQSYSRPRQVRSNVLRYLQSRIRNKQKNQ